MLAQSVEALEELATLITGNGVGMRVVGPHHMMLQGGVGGEISPALLADELLAAYPVYDLPVQRTFLLLEVESTQVDCPATGIFPDHFLTERTLDLLQLRVLVVHVLLQGLSRGKPFRAMFTGDFLLLISFLCFTRRI